MPRGKAVKSLRLIDACYSILEEIRPASVRAVCYRLFTMGLIPDMSKNKTNKVGSQLTWAREQGVIPWAWVIDETREAEMVPSWDDPAEFSEAVKSQYRRDRWALQRQRVEVWSEKGTVRGTLAPVLNEYGITFRVMHGYASATAIYDFARFTRPLAHPLQVLYVGDWDPSGLHMSDVDLPARLEEYGAYAVLMRRALDAEDCYLGGLPWFPAGDKRGDPRWKWYVKHHGQRCWELDALSPVVLRSRVQDAIRSMIDWDAWERCAKAEAAERESLVEVLSAWKAVTA